MEQPINCLARCNQGLTLRKNQVLTIIILMVIDLFATWLIVSKTSPSGELNVIIKQLWLLLGIDWGSIVGFFLALILILLFVYKIKLSIKFYYYFLGVYTIIFFMHGNIIHYLFFGV